MTKFFKRLLPAKLRNKLGDTEITIPVVKLSGMIMDSGSSLRSSLSLASCAEVLEKAFEDKQAPAVAIVINSPGGSPVQSRLIYRRIKDLALEKEKKVHVFVEDAAASGGYMIACAGDDITADPSSIVGSIGVVSSGFGFVDAIEKLGVSRRVYTAGQNKSVLDPFLPEKKADIERLKDLQLEIHQIFIDLVKESRSERLSDDKDLFTGLFWTGGKALEMGLVDAIGDLRSSMKARYGEKTNLKLVEAKRGFFSRRGLFGSALSSAQSFENISASATSGLVNTLEEKSLWSRLGL